MLTPYLGQLLNIQSALSEANLEVLIDDLDLDEARRRLDGVGDFKVTVSQRDYKKSVRVATIDNYQASRRLGAFKFYSAPHS